MIPIPTERAARLEEGARGTSDLKGNFRIASKEDIADHFNQPEYAILRPAEFRGDFRKNGNRAVNDAMVVYFRDLVYQSVTFNEHHYIEDCPCGELIEHERGVYMENLPPFDR